MSEVGLMSPEQFDQILSYLRAGSPLDQAVRRAHVSMTMLQSELDASENLSEIVDDCIAQGRAGQRQARSYKDDPLENIHESPPKEEIEPDPTPSSDEGFRAAIDAAAEMGDGLCGQLEWVERRCKLSKRHPIDPVWRDNYDQFFRSGKLIMGILAGLRAGKTTSSLRTIIPGALFTRHQVEPGEVAGIPIMSASTKLATLNLNEVEITLCACGMSPSRKGADGVGLPGGIGGTYRLTNSSSGGGVIEFINAHGARVRIMCLAANVASAVGYTAVGAFLDETEIWRNAKTSANPANEVLEAVQQRATTTYETAKIIVSSSFYPSVSARRIEKGAHQVLIETGDTDTVFIARLGELGADRDTKARLELARLIGSKDPRLLTPGDPSSPCIPAWASRTDIPIATFYRQSGNDIGKMLGSFGGRMDCIKAEQGNSAKGFGEFNRKLVAKGNRHNQLQTFDSLPSYDPRSSRYRPPGSGSGGCVM